MTKLDITKSSAVYTKIMHPFYGTEKIYFSDKDKNSNGDSCIITTTHFDGLYEILLDPVPPLYLKSELARSFKPVDMQWKNIDFVCKGKKILNDVSGIVRSGELTAIMGPSGAGKSTLLNILSGFKFQNVSGKILVNGAERDMRTHRKISSYVMQDDDLLPHLTVFETVYLAACLRIPTTVSKEVKIKAVDDCLMSLGLTECKQTKASKLSGGQRKRLCIAQELVSNPPVIFLDEPTSGLDSSSCLQCIKLLKSLANEGRTVVCSIHQPSTRIIELFDQLYMLASGQCIYRGPTNEFATFLAEQGLKCSPCHSITDFAIEIAIGEHGEWIEPLKKAVDAKQEPNKIRCWLESNLMSSQLYLDGKETEKTPFAPKKKVKEKLYNEYATNYWNQFKVLSYRSLICTFREPMATLVRLVSHIFFGATTGLLYYGIGNDANKVFNNTGCVFISLLFLIFTAMMPTALTFHTEIKIFSREYLNNWYDMKMYYLAKTITEIPFQIIFPVIFSCLVYWLTAQPCDSFRFFLFLYSTVMISFVAQSFSLIISAFTRVEIAVFLCPVLSIPFILFCGFIIIFPTIPDHLQIFSYLSYFRHGFHSTLIGLYAFDRPQLTCDKMFCLFKDPQAYLKELDMLEDNLYYQYGALWASFFGFRLIAYLALWYRVVYNR